jgi:hypothetical protein
MYRIHMISMKISNASSIHIVKISFLWYAIIVFMAWFFEKLFLVK